MLQVPGERGYIKPLMIVSSALPAIVRVVARVGSFNPISLLESHQDVHVCPQGMTVSMGISLSCSDGLFVRSSFRPALDLFGANSAMKEPCAPFIGPCCWTGWATGWYPLFMTQMGLPSDSLCPRSHWVVPFKGSGRKISTGKDSARPVPCLSNRQG
jgi:hypothetical protein